MRTGIEALRKDLHDVIDFVKTKNGRVTVTRWGRAVAEIIPVQKELCPPVVRRSALRKNPRPQGIPA